MKKLYWACVALLVPVSAFGGIDLSWNDCVGGGTESSNKQFVCTGQANQRYNLPLYFKVPESLPGFVGIRMDLDLVTGQADPSPFWHYEEGGCQRPGGNVPTGIQISDNVAAGAPGCQLFSDPWDGDGSSAFEGIATYIPDYQGTGRHRLVLGVARGSAFPLDFGVNYYACHLIFNNRHRTTCAGCTERVEIHFVSATLESNDEHPPLTIQFADKFGDCVTINGANSPTCTGVVPTRNMTWGRVKSLYR